MHLSSTTLKDLLLIKPDVHGDHRGFFLESYNHDTFKKNGITTLFIQDNHSCSKESGVLRGLHFQKPPYTQTKLIRVTKGKIFDVAVDLRKDSPAFGKWEGFELSAENFLMLLVPQGFAHGFCTLEPDTHVHYKVDALYSPSHDSGIIWNDPDLAITWPVKNPIISNKDMNLSLFKGCQLPF